MDIERDTDTVTKETAALVSEAKKIAGVNTSQLSDAIGTPRTTLNRKLAGHKQFTINELISISHFLEVPLHDLIPTPALAVGAA